MTESMNRSVSTATAIAAICNSYGLNTQEFSEMLEALGCITPEQRDKVIITSTAFAVRDMMDNRMKS